MLKKNKIKKGMFDVIITADSNDADYIYLVDNCVSKEELRGYCILDYIYSKGSIYTFRETFNVEDAAFTEVIKKALDKLDADYTDDFLERFYYYLMDYMPHYMCEPAHTLIDIEIYSNDGKYMLDYTKDDIKRYIIKEMRYC